MFLVNVLFGSAITSFLVVFPVFCSDFVRNENLPSEGLRPNESEAKSSRENFHQELKTSSDHSSGFVFRKQLFNESMENIQTLENGKLIKSSYIPLISKQSSYSYLRRGFDSYDDSPPVRNPSGNIGSTNETKGQKKENFVIKNGKKYRIVKVQKTVKHKYGEAPLNEIRRSFKLPSLSSILPFKWMTREKKNDTEHEKRSENATLWSKLESPQPEESSKEILKNGVRNSEKITKLLNLFSIVKFENGECYANGIKGTCLHQLECEAKGGKFAATCAEQLGVCCYSEKTCGESSNDNCTYFINEGFPDSSLAAPKVCTLTLEKTHAHIKQLRLDFQIFQLREPTNGTCLHDRLIVSGQDINDVVPDICGANTGQHIYVDVEDTNGPFNLNIITVGEYFPRNFRIKVTQIAKENPLLAPKNCLQYYTEPTGYVQTFNYQPEINENLDEITTGYFNNLNYAICFKKMKGFCSISYENEEADARHPTFQLVNVDEEGEKLLPPRQAGAETFDCPDDYIIVNGVRLCGEKLNDASVEIDYTRNYPVTDTSNGPFILSVRTDAAVSGRGFNLKFNQNPCLV